MIINIFSIYNYTIQYFLLYRIEKHLSCDVSIALLTFEPFIDIPKSLISK